MKDYKKILEGVMNIINTTEKSDIGFANICTYIGENCPELKESEDERILRCLKEIVDWGCAKNISVECGVSLKDVKSWLEKQKAIDVLNEEEKESAAYQVGYNEGVKVTLENQSEKIKPIEGFNTEFERQVSHLIASSINKDYEYTAAYVKWVADALWNYAKQEIEKQGEQPTDNDIKEGRADAIADFQKEWSEEDREMRMKVLKYLSTRCNVFEYEEVECWLKSLKDRVQPQSKQEWSEEDYNEIETIACHLDNIDNEGMAEVLRNIRDKYYYSIPQATWKPSDEQMQALSDAGNSFRPFEEGHKVLWSLYNDLKKLKGD